MSESGTPSPQTEQDEDQPASALSPDRAPLGQVDAMEMIDQPPQLVADRIEEIAPSDGGMVLGTLPPDRAADVAEHLDPNTAADIVASMDPAAAAAVVSAMEAPEAAVMLSAMDPDDRVDVLEFVPDEHREAVLGEMSALEAADIRNLQQYPPDSAGGIMTSEVTALSEYLTAEQAIQELRELNDQLEQMFYVYVVDRRGHLIGVLSMRDLILAKPDKLLSEIMIHNVRSVPATMDQEEVARLFRKHNYLAMPVVDERGRLLGLITVDDVVDVMEEEATEDVQKMFGAGAEERLSSPWKFSFQKRVWWLVVNLGTAFLAAAVVGFFEDTITQVAILAAYMPIVAGMGGNASAQAMAVTVRGLAMGRVDRALLKHVIVRELHVGVLTGVVCGVITAAIAYAFNQNAALGAVVGLALIINHTLACTSGAAIPFIMKRLGFDPAQSATIFATTVTDVVGFFCLLGLANMMMPWLRSP